MQPPQELPQELPQGASQPQCLLKRRLRSPSFSHTGTQTGYITYGLNVQNQTKIEGIDQTEGTDANATSKCRLR